MPNYDFLAYRSLSDLELAVQHMAMHLPDGIELVVGIPRSGLLAASIMALQLNLPLTDVEGFLEGRVLGTGRRVWRARREGAEGPRAIVVDDSVSTGRQFRETRALLESRGRAGEVLYAAPFVTGASADLVDVYAEVVEQPRIFAWNILHHDLLLARTCVDIDGVLCLDPAEEENDDGTRYREFLERARPLFLPTGRVGYVVTSRLERYRAETEAWLHRHGIEFDELVMLDLPDAATRRAQGAHASHKAAFYARSDAQLFIESEYRQAVEIAARSGRQVYSVDRREMIYPSPARAALRAPVPFARSVGRLPPAQAAYREARRVAGRAVGGRGTAAIRRTLGRRA